MAQTPYTLRKSERDLIWIAHAVLFDLMGADEIREKAIEQLRLCLIAQVAWSKQHGYPLMQCYFAAPKEYWTPPFEFMEMPSDEEIAACKFEAVVGVTER